MTREDLWHRLLVDNPAARSEQVALRWDDRSLDYGGLIAAVRELAEGLCGAGVVPGDRVVLALRNSAEYVVGFFAVVAAGAIAVPVDPQVGAERLRAVVEEVRPRLGLQLEGHAVAIAGTAWHSLRLAIGGLVAPTLGSRAPLPVVAGEDEACMLFSAGSTGRPKGVLLRHRQLRAIAGTLVGVIGMGPGHRDLILSPMTHSGGWQRVAATLLAGGTVVVFTGMFSIAALADDVERFAISGFFTAPPVLRAILRAGPGKFAAAAASLRSIEIASAPVSAAELEQLAALFPAIDIYLQYGLSECSRAVILDVRRYPEKMHTVGLPTAGVEVAIRGADGGMLGVDEEGEILLRAPQRSDRYWGGVALAAEEWLATGDHGVIDGQGFLALRGRRDDMINCGGNSYFPAEVERLLGELPGVTEYLVAGVADRQGVLGQVPWIFVVAGAAGWSVGEFMRTARARLPAHMVPREVVQVPAIATAAGGKPSRRETLRRYGPGAEQG